MNMETVKARRGVCIGVNHHLKADDVVDLEANLVTYLVGIGAVERVTAAPPAPAPAEDPPTDAHEPDDDLEQRAMDLDKAAPAESGRKKR